MKIIKELLTINDYSRPGIKLTSIKDVIVHYVGNPNTSAEANRNYFENLRKQKATGNKIIDAKLRYASSHYIVGLNGEIIQCIPEDEVAYHAGNLNVNYNSIGIEVCHPSANGEFSNVTVTALVVLLQDITKRYNLNADHIKRHYDITKKMCPLYYVKNPNAWASLKSMVIAKPVVKPINKPVSKYWYARYITKSRMNVRKTPSIFGKVLEVYPNGTVFDIHEEVKGWGHSPSGWVYLPYCKKI